MTGEVNGIAPIQLPVGNPDQCLPFWERLCHFLEMKTLLKNEGAPGVLPVLYCIGSRTGILIRGVPEENANEAFNQDRPGLHHFCFRARSKTDVDEIFDFIDGELEAKIIHGPEDGSEFAPGYYSILFEDPGGTRVEVNHVPGRGHLGDGGRLGPEGSGPADRYGEGGLSDS